MKKVVKKAVKKSVATKPVKKAKATASLPSRKPGQILVGDVVRVMTTYKIKRIDDKLKMAVGDDKYGDRSLTFRNEELVVIEEAS